MAACTNPIRTFLASLCCLVLVAAAACNDAGTTAGAPDLVGFLCQRDGDCTDVAAPYCDTTSHRCVNCTRNSNTCSQGFACVDLYDSGYPYCVESCRSPGDCTRGETGCCKNGCVDLTRNTFHCGACGHRCDPWLTCLKGTCTCPTYAPDLCGQRCVNLLADSNNCGACDHLCPSPQNGYAQCLGGTCGPGVCYGGYADCDGKSDNGCEQSLFNDDNNCGACGTVCPQGKHCNYRSCR